ncbi:putative aminotransferase [Fusarium austroafricanum]|uniref:Putative aminotransferase n=1 Tax=Fusarium austroafricanum TaxID=2364996 RepID=A0A8H4NA73_9HYPO|nr:putative aminotransferase [Fusarium austroafricanum]
MPRHRPRRLNHIQGIGVDQMGQIADASDADYLRLENLDVNIPPDPEALDYTERAIRLDENNSYLPFIGNRSLRNVAARHVSHMSGVEYSGDRNCTISAGGLSGILNVLLATVEEGDEVIVTDPTYRGLINRVLLAGGIPKFVPWTFSPGNVWELDHDALRSAISPRTSAMLLMSPSMPNGGFLTPSDWVLISELCVVNDLLLILDTAMERLLFDGRSVIHPAGFPGMTERTVTIGSSSKELRMIGWRVGWIVGPEELMDDIAAVSMANVVVPVGIAQDAVAIALERSRATMQEYVAELQARRDLILSELAGLPVGVPAGGWSLLLRVSDFGMNGSAVSQRLLEQGICATAMDGWGEVHGSEYVRFVFSNETQERLRGIGDKARVVESMQGYLFYYDFAREK